MQKFDNPFLEVRKERLFTADQTPSSRYAVFLTDDEADGAEYEVGTVSENYNLVPNEEVHQTALDVLNRSELEYEASTSRFDGKKYTQRWLMPTLQVEPRKDDIVQISLDLVNSYDGSTTFGLMFNAQRLACVNGMMVDHQLGGYKFRHINQDNYQEQLQQAADRIIALNNALPGFTNKIQAMIETPVDREFTQNMFKHLKFGPSLIGQIYQAIEEDNVWGLYNACTQALTEKDSFRGDAINRQVGKFLIAA